ncbi:hypothetical protein MKZ38_010733 [Zalerion maritima]|uniref:Uncharacterized protein n=1 Tax=Zalerion maritima TaxID=339359 RepID=A0AAD5RY49_9PEZI|nr:hypothetical protein MKZ38_010733 [Zalerion maritima]
MAGDEEPPKNPFIRWKNHVDSHISTTLQGVIGLPSAVSRNLNLRGWPEVEEARRKELEKQQQMQQQDEVEKQTPSAPAKEPQQAAPADNKLNPSHGTDSTPAGWTVAFFSPRDRDHCSRAHSGPNGFGPPGSGAGPNSDPSGNSNDPNNWSSWPDWVQQARWHSFAAYSPYSPLNLRHMPQPRPLGLPASEQSNFTFEDAFEDLLTVMCGRELPPINEKADMRRVLGSMFPTGEPAFYWVRRLQAQGLLNGYFPRADQVRKQLEERFDADSEEEKQRKAELDEKRGRMWKWVWSRHHNMGGGHKNGENKKSDSADAKSFEEWDPEDWVKEMDSILSQAAKDVRNELNKDGHIFGELERIFKAVGKVGESLSGIGENNQPGPKVQERIEEKKDMVEESEEDYFSALAKASGSASASTTTSTGTETSSSFGNMARVFHGQDGSTSTTHSSSSYDDNKARGPFQNTSTEESTDPATGVRTIKTTEEKVDKRGNRTIRTEIKKLNSDGDEISRQTSYAKSMSASWSWSSSSGSGSDDDGWSSSRKNGNGENGENGEKDSKTGWFWR